MELAGRPGQGRLGMHDPSSHQHGPQWHQRSEKKEPPLEDPRIHNEHEQRRGLRGPGTRPTTEDEPRKHGPPDAQKHVSKFTGISTSNQKKEEVCKARPLDPCSLKPIGPFPGLTVRGGHRSRGPRGRSLQPHGIDRPISRPNALRSCLNDP